jgi:NAD(P)H-dependent FMN reductase
MGSSNSIRIVGLNGSPHRNGNTVALMRWILEGCAEAGAEVEWIHLIDWEVRYRQGCFTCLRTGTCPIQDDYQSILSQLLAAGGVVVGSPVYEGQPTAQLKTFLDRMTLLGLYTRTYEAQRSVGVATSGVAPTAGVAKYVAGMFGQRCGVIGAKTTSIAHGYQRLAEVHDRRLPERARALGRSLVARIQTAHQPRFPTPAHLWYGILARFVLQPMVARNAEQFAGVLQIWREKGWLRDGESFNGGEQLQWGRAASTPCLSDEAGRMAIPWPDTRRTSSV